MTIVPVEDLFILLTDFDIKTRYLINRFFAEEGLPPTTYDLAVLQECRPKMIADSLSRLEEDHRLLLYPNSYDIWVAHPFSAISTNYWVEVGNRGWWGNCAFCSLGIAAMFGGEATIYSRLQAERSPIEIRTSISSIHPSDYYLHIPLPVSRWHQNVTFTCGNVHYFECPEAIDRWSERHLLPRGKEISLIRAWDLAKGWYGDYLEPSWRPLSNLETNALFHKCGLDDPFWRIPES